MDGHCIHFKNSITMTDEHLDATYLSIFNHSSILKDLIYLNGNHALKFTSSGA